VRHFCSGNALAGVEATVYRVRDGKPDHSRAHGPAKTDASGEFLLDGLEPGTWQLNLTRSGFATTLRVVVVFAGERRRIEERLTPDIKPGPSTTPLDVLFVVDNSNSMQEEQQELSKAFPAFMKSLERVLADHTLDLRLGVISTDLGTGKYNTINSCERVGGDGGKLQTKPRRKGCATPTDPWLAAAAGKQNFKGTIESAFSCIAELGTAGCGFEQPLAAALRALDGKTNPGFPRQGAALAVVVLSDEDDCSAQDTGLFNPNSQVLGPPTSFRCFDYGVDCDVDDRWVLGPRKGCKPWGTYLTDVGAVVTGLRKGRDSRSVFFAAISGRVDRVEVIKGSGGNPDLRPSCQSKTGVAYPAIRLKAVADKMHPYSYFNTLCDGDLDLILGELATQIALRAIFNPCK
jgi:hypothetical protein